MIYAVNVIGTWTSSKQYPATASSGWRHDMCNAELHHSICGQLSAHHGGHLAAYLLELIKVHIPAAPQGQQQASAAGLKPSVPFCSSV